MSDLHNLGPADDSLASADAAPLAPFSVRVCAAVINLFITAALLFPLDRALYALSGTPTSSTSAPAELISLGFAVGVHAYLHKRWGASPGKTLLFLRVVDNGTGEPIGFARTIVRVLASFIALLSVVGYVWAAFDRRGRGLHDRISRTRVVDTAPQTAATQRTHSVAIDASFVESNWFGAFVLILATVGLASAVFTLASPPEYDRNGDLFVIFQSIRYIRWVGAALGSAIAIVLIVRGGRIQHARMLALALAAYYFSTRIHELVGMPHGFPDKLMYPADWIAFGALLHFAILFPTPVTVTALEAARRATVMHRLQKWVYRIRSSVHNGGAGAETSFPNGAATLAFGILDPRVIWSVALIPALIIPLAYPDTSAKPGWLNVVLFLIGAFLVGQAAWVLRLRLRASHGTERDQLLWVAQGAYAAVLVPIVIATALAGLYVALIIALVADPRLEPLQGLLIRLTIPTQSAIKVLPPVILTLSLAFAVFYRGSIDPALAVRRTTLYAALTVIGMGIFATLEYLISSQVSHYLHLSNAAASIVAGLLATGGAGALRTRLKSRTDEYFDRLLPPRAAVKEAQRNERTIAFADLVGFTAAASSNEEEALAAATLFHKEARTSLRGLNARLVKTVGDAVLLEFREPVHALRALRILAERFPRALAAYGLPPLAFRAGVHRGVVISDRTGDIFGETVNLAARLQTSATPGCVLVTAQVNSAIDATTGWILECRGEIELKNIPLPVRVWEAQLVTEKQPRFESPRP
ncbi:MAG: RDD family protein [Longimicrobiales bacterium]